MILQFIMKMTLIQHYESRIIRQPQGIAPTIKSNFTDGVPHNYALCITNYELIQTRTSVRLYERAGSPDVWITPNNYELCIMNYALIHRLYSIYVFTSSATHFS